MAPYYIARYGFYEGSVEYRVEPEDIIDMFLQSSLSDSNIGFSKEDTAL